MLHWIFKYPSPGNFTSEAEALAHGAMWGAIASVIVVGIVWLTA